MNIKNSLIWILNSNQSNNPEQIFIQTLMYPNTSLVQVFYKCSSLAIEYHNQGFNLSLLTLLVPMSASRKPPSHHTILCRLNSSLFLTKWILLVLFLVCLMSLPLLVIHTAYLLSNINTRDCSGTTSGSFFNNSIFSILKRDRAITAVHAEL